MDPPNVYAPPKTAPPLPGARAAPKGFEQAKYAGFPIRLAARLVDGVVLVVTLWFAGMTAGFLTAVLEIAPVAPRQSQASQLAMGIAVLVGLTVYHSVAEGLGGATAGKWVLGLRVANDDFSPCSFTAACVRNLGFWLDVFGLGLAGGLAMSASRRKKRVGDRVAKTIVYDIGRVKREVDLPPVGLGILAGLVLYAVTMLAAFYACAGIG